MAVVCVNGVVGSGCSQRCCLQKRSPGGRLFGLVLKRSFLGNSSQCIRDVFGLEIGWFVVTVACFWRRQGSADTTEKSI